ncbi:F-box domain containing protein [Tanacetum coccineum]
MKPYNGPKVHDCHIMMQRLLPYGLQNYLPDKIAKPIIELCSLFKQICSATLMEDDMLKAQIKVVDILCDLELIYPPALFDIMIHLVIHLPLEALEGGPIRPRWMFPFERYMKKLKGYVRNKAKPEGSIAEGYVAEEALTFSSHYFWDVTTKFNRPDHNVDPPPPTPEIDTYRSQFKSLFPNKDMKEEFPEWFGSQIRQRHVDNDKDPEDDLDIIHFDNSSDLPLSTSLNDLDNATLHIDGQSTEVDAPPDIIDVMSVDVARSYGGDGGGEDRPPPHHVPTGCMGCFANRGKGKRKPNLGGRAAGRLNTRDKTRNLSLKEITDKKGPVPIRFELRDKQTLMPLGDHAAHWSSYIGETQFDLRPHMESTDWTEINAGIQQHLQKAYNTNKAAFKAQHWVIDPTTGTYNVEKIRRARPEDITAEEWDKYIQFWNDPRNIARVAQNRQNRNKEHGHISTGIPRHSSATQEYPSLIDTFFVAHTVNGEFLQDEDRRIYEEMRRLEATGTYTDDEINRLARRGKQRGHIPGVGRVLPARATAGPSTPASESTLNSLHKKVDFMMSLFKSDSKYSDMFSQFESGGASGSGGCGDDEESVDDQEDEDEDGDGDS